jgi:Protein of unknown function (DUF3179)
VWGRDVAGLRLTFHLAGINNQNFLMRDDQTGTYWQQISGKAISGPLRGSQLPFVHSDELTFGTWQSEEPQGTVLQDAAKYASGYARKDWDVRMQRARTVIDFREHGLKGRDLMLGIQAFGASRAFPYDQVMKEKLIQDHVGAEPVLLVVGGDGQSVRAFRDRIPGIHGAPDFYRMPGNQSGTPGALLMDAATGSDWNFQGCAVSGKAKGSCLEPVEVIKDYWFDWRNFNPSTTVYGRK